MLKISEEMHVDLHEKALMVDFNLIWDYLYTSVKLPNIKFHENSFGSSRVISCVQTDAYKRRCRVANVRKTQTIGTDWGSLGTEGCHQPDCRPHVPSVVADNEVIPVKMERHNRNKSVITCE
jgi:hypothetical protein